MREEYFDISDQSLYLFLLLLNDGEHPIEYLIPATTWDNDSIRSLSFLSDAEKDELIADYNRLVELDNQLCKLYDTIWGNTGCEGGICPL